MFGIAENHEFLAALGIENAPNRDSIVADLERIAQNKLTVKISDCLTPAQLEEFNAIADERESADWIAANLPNIYDLVTEVFSEIRDEFLAEKATILGRLGYQAGIEKGEIVTLSNNRDYVCIGIVFFEGRKYLYLMTKTEPVGFCMAEETVQDNGSKLRMIGSSDEKRKLFELFKAQLQGNP